MSLVIARQQTPSALNTRIYKNLNSRNVKIDFFSIADTYLRDVIENWLPVMKQILSLDYKMKSGSIFFIVKNNKY